MDIQNREIDMQGREMDLQDRETDLQNREMNMQSAEMDMQNPEVLNLAKNRVLKIFLGWGMFFLVMRRRALDF